MSTLIEESVVDNVLAAMEIDDLNNASIRQIGGVVHSIEEQSGQEFIHFEIGVPGLPAAEVGIEAQCGALHGGVAAKYPPIDGIPQLKQAASRFIKAFINTDLAPEGCIPTVGSMQGSFASLLLCSKIDSKRDTILYIDPGFSVQKTQAQVLGIKTASFDLFDYRNGLLGDKLEEFFSRGNIAAIIYSNPNNPTWMCLSDDELRTIGRLADKYDVVVIEDLAYIGMDFRRHLGTPFVEPYQVSVSHYTDNYILLLSGSKIFSYAGERIAVSAISDKLYNRFYPCLKDSLGVGRFGKAFVQRIIYTTTSGVSHSAQYALAAMMSAACDGQYDFVKVTSEYARRSARIKEILLRHGFNIIYDRDIDEQLSDGFFFTIGYHDMDGAELLHRLLCYGISGILLSTTGSMRQGLRACSSAIAERHYDMLEQRVARFDADNRERFI